MSLLLHNIVMKTQKQSLKTKQVLACNSIYSSLIIFRLGNLFSFHYTETIKKILFFFGGGKRLIFRFQCKLHKKKLWNTVKITISTNFYIEFTFNNNKYTRIDQ